MSLKKYAGFIIVLGVVNAICAVIVAMLVTPLAAVDASMATALVALLASSSLALLVTGVALWNLHGDIEANIVSTNTFIAAMKKRIEALENK